MLYSTWLLMICISICAFLHLKSFSRRSCNTSTELHNMPVTFSILGGRGPLLVPGLSSWMHISWEICEIFHCIQPDQGRPLPAFRSNEPVLSIFHKTLLTDLPFSALTLLVGQHGRKGIRLVKYWVVWCWHGYLSGAMCRFAITISCSSKSRLVLPFWYQLTRVVLTKSTEP